MMSEPAANFQFKGPIGLLVSFTFTCSPLLASRRSARPSPRRGRTPSPSGSCGPPERTAWTISSSSHDDVSRWCSPSTSTTTTMPGRTEAWPWLNRCPARWPRPVGCKYSNHRLNWDNVGPA